MEDGDFQGSLSRERRNEGGGLSVRQGFSRLVSGDFSIHVLTPISLCKESTTCIRGNFLSNEPPPPPPPRGDLGMSTGLRITAGPVVLYF